MLLCVISCGCASILSIAAAAYGGHLLHAQWCCLTSLASVEVQSRFLPFATTPKGGWGITSVVMLLLQTALCCTSCPGLLLCAVTVVLLSLCLHFEHAVFVPPGSCQLLNQPLHRTNRDTAHNELQYVQPCRYAIQEELKLSKGRGPGI